MSHQEVNCPHCSKAFTIDEAGYANILKQVRDQTFESEISARLKLAEEEKLTAIELAKTQTLSQTQKELASRESELESLKVRLGSLSTEQELAVKNAVTLVEKARDESISELNTKLQVLVAKLDATETEKKLAVAEAVGEAEKERDQLRGTLDQNKLHHELAHKALQEKYETQLNDRDEAIDRLKDMKARLSTKMLGETLEQHCEIQFNQLRATAFQNAYFEKDNDVRSGSKGDYIFRESDEQENEVVSIMFEMKNEADTTATKKKNEDFFKELDKDRTEKGCEYAILVSSLESESELYNSGIVDVSHRYPKMYVIRPQFFIPIITLLRNAALNSLQFKQELALVKAQNIDITNFETELQDFKNAFGRNYDLAARQYQTAIDEIDKSINHLTKTKEALMKSGNNLRLANDKARDVSIKRLTRNNSTMSQKFKALSE